LVAGRGSASLRATPPAMFTRLAFAVLALTLPLAAQSPSPGPATQESTSVALAQAPRLQVARNGDEVILTWDLSGLPVKGLDIYRNASERTKGRGRLDYVKPAPSVFIDKLPDSAGTYWYWLKVALVSGESVNVGPVATPSGMVWTP
jgi:hypothetical protein